MTTKTRKTLYGLAILLLSLPLLLVALGAGLAAPLPPAPDASLPIPLPGGGTATLGELVAAPPVFGAAPASPADDGRRAAEAATDPGAGEGAGEKTEAAAETAASAFTWLRSPDDRDLYRLGRELAHRGNTEQAAALLRSVPPSHPQYARAQRFLGWDLYTRELNQPRVGMAFVNQSLRANPFDGNVWQDGYRVLGKAMFAGG